MKLIPWILYLMLLDVSLMLKNVTIYNEGVDDLSLSFAAALKEVKIRELVDSHLPPIATGIG